MPLPLDPERYIQRLAPLGAILIVVGVAISRIWSLPLTLVGVLLLVASCWSRQDGLLLFGPFVGQELRAVTRRSRVHLWRTIVAVIGGAAFCAAASMRQF